MDDFSKGFEQIVRNFVRWGQERNDIRLAFVLGSRARTDHPADEWSDLDLAVCATDIQPYLDQADWVAAMGKPWLTFVEVTGDGRSMERRVLYDGGLDVDFALLPLEMLRHLVQASMDPAAADLFHRGVRVLFDKDGLLPDPAAIAATWQPPAPPSQAEFLQVVNDFWYHAVWTAKHLRRGELWWAKLGCDSHLKDLLRRMLEWQAQAARGSGHDTWLRGRFLEEWADPRAVAALGGAFAHYDEQEIWRALFATLDLFRWVSEEAAGKLKYGLPTEGITVTEKLVRKLAQGEEKPPRI